MRLRRILAGLLVMVMVLALAGCASTMPKAKPGTNPDYRACLITDSGDITDQSFNQMSYEALSAYCEENNIDYTYKKPDGATEYARTAMVDLAVAEGYNIIIMPGYSFAATLVETTYKYPDIKFISLDMTAGDIIASAVGNAYYADPDAYAAEDYYNTGNTYCAVYQEEIPGYMVGYTAVKLGYRKLAYLGGMAVPAVMRFGYGYLQGIDEAAKELGVTDEIDVQYAYGGQFFGSTEITAAMETWYSKGTEIVFACGGGIYTSAAEAAAKVNGKVIGVDSDQAGVINAYGTDMAVTSAMKNIGATIRAMMDAIIFDGTWGEHVGKIENLGLVSGTDMSVNYVGLPEDTTQWNEGFTVNDYHDLVKKIYDGELAISSSVDKEPDVAIKYNIRQGTIM